MVLCSFFSESMGIYKVIFKVLGGIIFFVFCLYSYKKLIGRKRECGILHQVFEINILRKEKGANKHQVFVINISFIFVQMNSGISHQVFVINISGVFFIFVQFF